MKARAKQNAKGKEAVSYDTAPTPTATEYSAFERAYKFLNEKLFEGKLPDVLITLQRKANTYGYFHGEKFRARNGTASVSEIALNPDTFSARSTREIISTLAHEMVHVWEHVNGTAPRRCYHNQEWATKMKAIGLQPSDTAEPGGKETGQSVSHYIVEGGPFARAYDELLDAGFELTWNSTPPPDKAAAKKKAASKTKFTCPACGQNAWGKPDSLLVCGVCFEDDDSDPIIMEAEQ